MKYELTDTTMENQDGITLHRIRALKNFADVTVGDIGGWIEKEENLSQEGNCWVYGDAAVSGEMHILDNAAIKDSAKAHTRQYSEISGNAVLRDHAITIGDNIKITDDAEVSDGAKVMSNSKISGHAKIHGNANINGRTTVSDYAEVTDNVFTMEMAYISGHAKVSGNTHMYGNSSVSGNAQVKNCFLENTASIKGNAIVESTNMRGSAKISGNAKVSGNLMHGSKAELSENAYVSGNARIAAKVKLHGNAQVLGETKILENVRLNVNALIKDSSDYMKLDEYGKNACAFRCSDGSVRMTIQNSIYTPESFRAYIETLMPEISKDHLEMLTHVKEHFGLPEFTYRMPFSLSAPYDANQPFSLDPERHGFYLRQFDALPKAIDLYDDKSISNCFVRWIKIDMADFAASGSGPMTDTILSSRCHLNDASSGYFEIVTNRELTSAEMEGLSHYMQHFETPISCDKIDHMNFEGQWFREHSVSTEDDLSLGDALSDLESQIQNNDLQV